MIYHNSLYCILVLLSLAIACTTKKKHISYQPDISGSNEFIPTIKEQDVQLNASINTRMVENGKTIYLNKCKICHYLSTAKLTGPGWKNITQRRTPAWIMNMILYPDLMVANDPEAKKQRQMFNIAMPAIGLSVDDARAVLEFMRSNNLLK
jgi:Cytochrome c